MNQSVYKSPEPPVRIGKAERGVIAEPERRKVMDYSSYQHLLIEKKDGIALLTINRPESLNSTNFRLHNELSRVWLDLAEDDEVRVAVITGAGRAFSAGGDFEVVEKSMGNLEVV